jgi:arylsulfatase A-like enzyme
MAAAPTPEFHFLILAVRRRLRAFQFLLAGLTAALVLGGLQPALAAVTGTSAATDRPNLVIIIGDDISIDDFGCYGHPTIRTPNIDRLAAGGLQFENAYVATSSCSPSRCSIIASRYPHNLGTAAELHGPLPRGIPLLPQLLRDAGYHAAQAGKIHFGEVTGGPGQEAFDASGMLPGDFGGEAEWVDRLRKRPMEKPFFMWFAAHDAHRDWQTESFAGMNRLKDIQVPPTLADTPGTRQDLAHYYDEVTRLDYHVGEVMEELRRQKVVDNTIVIFMSDNGRPFPRSKTTLYDDGVKTPFIVHWPAGIPRPAKAHGLISAIDIAPTLLELAGVPRPATFQGVSFLPILCNPAATVRETTSSRRRTGTTSPRTCGWCGIGILSTSAMPGPGSSSPAPRTRSTIRVRMR